MGGQLRVHMDGGAESGAWGDSCPPRVGGGAGRKWDIEPVLDRLVLFRSDLVDHGVRK